VTSYLPGIEGQRATLVETIAGATGYKRAAIAFVAGALSVLALAPFFLWPILFFTFPVLVWLIDGAVANGPDARARARAAALVGWWFGFGYFAAGLFWIGEAFLVEADKFAWALPIAVTALPAGLALFYALATAAASLVWRHGLSRIIWLAVALALAEWLRGHVLTGFPWNVLGYALTWPLPLMQTAALFGIYGLTLWAVVLCATPLVAVTELAPERKGTLAGVLGAVVLALGGLYAYGALRLSHDPLPMRDGVHLRLVQPSVPQREKWRPENQRAIFADHLNLSRTNAAGARDDLAGVTHVVWPEAAMPFLPLDHPEALQAIGELLPEGTSLLSGALRVQWPADTTQPGAKREAFNSLMVFDANGALASVYDKIHLVPFGEYLPFQGFLESIGLEQLSRMRGGFSAGPTPRPLLHVPGLPPLGVLICYEAVFPAAVVQGDERPGVLLNVTNDGWFGNTTGPRQHLQQARVRAVEEGLPLIRVANNGISAMIDPEGRLLQQLGLNERGVIDTGLPQALPPPPYARYGDLLFVFILALFSVTGLLVRIYLPR
jgi:apolipoprotein N-acyltransferase